MERYGETMSDDSTIKIRPHRVAGVLVDQRMLIPSAEAVMRQIVAVPAGETRSLGEVRQRLAQQHGADATCPVTTQRMIGIVAAKAVEDHREGREAVPFWRVVDPQKPSSERLPGGGAFIAARRREEKP